MKLSSQRGLAVVTGAAGGLGSSFANKLAERGYRLLLVDRRQAPLERLCESIAARHGDCAEPYAIDLCNREELERLATRLAQTADMALLVNNAGFGSVDYFVDTDANYLVSQVDVHIAAPTMLTRAVLPGMIERNSGAIINVSSVGAWVPAAGNAQYGSTKGYLAMISLALQQELLGTNVHVHALCPAFVRDTGFHAAENMQKFKERAPAHMWLSPDEVVECALRSLGGKQVIVVPGFKIRILARFAQMPVLRPLLQWITRVPPRLASNPLPSLACAEATLGEAKQV
jgi:short-subunit dehydrogenase